MLFPKFLFLFTSFAHITFLSLISAAPRQVLVPGLVLIGGLFPIHESSRNASGSSLCGRIKADQGVQRMVNFIFKSEISDLCQPFLFNQSSQPLTWTSLWLIPQFEFVSDISHLSSKPLTMSHSDYPIFRFSYFLEHVFWSKFIQAKPPTYAALMLD